MIFAFKSSYISASFFTFCLLVVMALCCLCSSTTTKPYDSMLCLDHERQALLQFKHGLIDETHRLASWVDEKSDCCKWAGILCNNVTGHVQKIHLPTAKCSYDDYNTDKESEEGMKKRLRGDISPSILKLKQLHHLDLSCNDFRGIQILSFMGSLGNLRYLNLSRSLFGGTIPPQLGNLTELEVLCLGSFYDDENYQYESTSIVNMQWLSSLSLLRHLDMSGVNLTKATDWLQVINTLPSLEQLHFRNSQLVDIHPNVAFLNLTSLSLLDLSGNYFHKSSMPPWIFSITSLVSLDLSWCGFLYGPIPGSICSFHNLTSLKLLHISGNEFMNSSLVLKGLSSIGGNLISLDMSGCRVSSSALDSLHNLTSLLSLDLSGNQLTRRLPKSLGNICNLRDIDMSWNYFPNISLTNLLESFLDCKSPSLESLSIMGSSLSTFLPSQLGQLINLVYLQLSNNQLIDTLPESLSQLSKLEILGISNNLLTGVLTDSHFSNLKGLKYLFGGGNNLTLRPRSANWIPSFQLESMDLSYWDLGPQFPSWLLTQRDLIFLDMRNTRISSTMPESFWRSLSRLQYLFLSQNQIQGWLFDIPATLVVVDLNSNMFSGKLPKLFDASWLMGLDLSNNRFTGSLHDLLCPYGGIWLSALNLANNHLSGVIPECWVKWPSLNSLNLENNNLSGRIPTTMGSLSSLWSLNMCKNKLSGELPASLKKLSKLKILQFATNELVGSIPAWIGTELSSLRILNLRSNNFDGKITHELCYLTSIQILDLAQNNLSGNIPECFNNFSVMSNKEAPSINQFGFEDGDYVDSKSSASLVTKGQEYTYSTILGLVILLDLSSNNLSGSIPVELMALQALRSLNLSNNQLTGVIPKNIGDLKSLESFDASLNHLFGELPTSLSYLNFLSSFNVSFNNLSGRIPSTTQLQTFNESSFFGNKLCGVPLTKGCGQPVHNKSKQEGDESHGMDLGLIISSLLGFIVGFWVVFAPLNAATIWNLLVK